jgi:hypothetical protein
MPVIPASGEGTLADNTVSPADDGAGAARSLDACHRTEQGVRGQAGEKMPLCHCHEGTGQVG